MSEKEISKRKLICNTTANVRYAETDETVNDIISECSTTRHDCVGMVIHWELCKRLKFDHIMKWYMYKPESILEKVTHKFF